MKELARLALHRFGQIPTDEDGDLALFETEAIVLHIAERHAGLVRDDANAWARAMVGSGGRCGLTEVGAVGWPGYREGRSSPRAFAYATRIAWEYSSFRRYVAAGLYPAGWGGE
jgi:glutathione S-transferase